MLLNSLSIGEGWGTKDYTELPPLYRLDPFSRSDGCGILAFKQVNLRLISRVKIEILKLQNDMKITTNLAETVALSIHDLNFLASDGDRSKSTPAAPIDCMKGVALYKLRVVARLRHKLSVQISTSKIDSSLEDSFLRFCLRGYSFVSQLIPLVIGKLTGHFPSGSIIQGETRHPDVGAGPLAEGQVSKPYLLSFVIEERALLKYGEVSLYLNGGSSFEGDFSDSAAWCGILKRSSKLMQGVMAVMEMHGDVCVRKANNIYSVDIPSGVDVSLTPLCLAHLVSTYNKYASSVKTHHKRCSYRKVDTKNTQSVDKFQSSSNTICRFNCENFKFASECLGVQIRKAMCQYNVSQYASLI